MRKWVTWALLVFILLIVFVVIVYSKGNDKKEVLNDNSQIVGNESPQKFVNESNTNYPSEKYPNFYIYYSFGVSEVNILDTKNNLYVKDMICKPKMSYTLILTDDDKYLINKSLSDNDFFNLKNNFTTNCDVSGNCGMMSPSSSAALTVTLNNKVKTIIWRSEYLYPDDSDLIKFMKIQKVIEDIISQREKAMNITQPTCLYL
ncbi:MAG TPA: hypothetical protein VJH92_04300 [Candidatus Nanoarchaeia archaeon]|nr:hypothetical protein [Candidatus Nanoarchaeia archaeon]